PEGCLLAEPAEAWWRIFRRNAPAGQTFADPTEIAQATEVATAELNNCAKPWVWGGPPSGSVAPDLTGLGFRPAERRPSRRMEIPSRRASDSQVAGGT
ncbi:MAG TPA: hypothetical protein VE823_04925, partial [Geodermatophilus sp.]|nr:hypothetical protein [Geodermatophilus sp.]